jgi:hypothetical protein
MTLGPMNASSTNSRGNIVGGSAAPNNTQTIAAKRMSLATVGPPTAFASMTAVPGASRRMSMGVALPPPIRQPGSDPAATMRYVVSHIGVM